MKVVYTDVLVIGGGLAGLRMAIAAKRRGHEASVLSLVPPKRSHSKAAQGGMQASLGNVIKGQGDNEDVHFEDTVRGSDWGADQEVVRMFVNTAPKAVRELAAWGVPWSRVRKGDRTVVINGQRSRSPSATRRTAWSRSATSAAPRSGAPAMSPTAPATRCCRRSATGRSPTASRCTSAPRRWR
jgi:succinate dehydrogenase/fumarate reductase flavoprotein subunit